MFVDDQEKPRTFYDVGPGTQKQAMLFEHGQGGTARYVVTGNPFAFLLGPFDEVLGAFASVFTGHRQKPEEHATLHSLEDMNRRDVRLPAEVPERPMDRFRRTFYSAQFGINTLPDTSVGAASYPGLEGSEGILGYG